MAEPTFTKASLLAALTLVNTTRLTLDSVDTTNEHAFSDAEDAWMSARADFDRELSGLTDLSADQLRGALN